MPPKKKDPANSLATLRDRMERTWGPQQIVRREEVKPYEVVPTGSLMLDTALRVGGWARGRMHEIVGPEGSAKTTVAITSMAEAQILWPDLAVGYIDMEQTFDYPRAEELGLDTSKDRFLHLYPDHAEDVSDMLQQQAETKIFSVIVVDSIGGMESKKAFDKEAQDAVMGNNAQVITRMVKRTAVTARRNNVAIILVNQHRANLNGGQDISAGPKALKYSTTTKVNMAEIYVEKKEDRMIVKDGPDEVLVGRKFRARVTRNKIALDGKSAEFFLVNADTDEYGPVGIDQADEATVLGIRMGIIAQGGAWYTMPDGTRLNGRRAVWERLKGDLGMVEDIRSKALARLRGDVEENVETTFVDAAEVGA